MSESPRPQDENPRWVLLFLVGTIVLAGLGFVVKLVDFSLSWIQSDGLDFAIVPVATYLAVAGGYMCLFAWAWRRRMFEDIEGPKYRMLEMQDAFDRGEGIEP